MVCGDSGFSIENIWEYPKAITFLEFFQILVVTMVCKFEAKKKSSIVLISWRQQLVPRAKAYPLKKKKTWKILWFIFPHWACFQPTPVQAVAHLQSSHNNFFCTFSARKKRMLAKFRLNCIWRLNDRLIVSCHLNVHWEAASVPG